MKGGDDTRIGGDGGRFPTTHWTVIDQVEPGNTAQSRLLIGRLVTDYWKPVYCYLRRKGYGNEEAKDLTQGFFQEVVLGRKLIERADSARGRFRTLVLTALDRYLANSATLARMDLRKLHPHLQADAFTSRGDLRLWPHIHDCDGFFACLMEKTGSKAEGKAKSKQS